MAHWFKLSGLIVGASILSACVAGSATDVDEEDGETDSQSLIGEARPVSNGLNNTCMTRANTTDGSAVELAACNGSVNQQWIFKQRANGLYEINANGTDKCITIEGSSKTDGARGIQWRCGGTNDQLFRIDNTSLAQTRITNVNSGKCLDASVGPASGGVRLIQWRCGDGASQRWSQR